MRERGSPRASVLGAAMAVVALLVAGSATPRGRRCEAEAKARVGEEWPLLVRGPRAADLVSAAADHRVWRREVRVAGASYLAPHFERLDLGEGDALVVRSPDGRRRWKYGRLEIGDPRRSGFWGLDVPGDTLVIELHARGPAASFVIDRVARGLASARSGGALDVCGVDDTREATCYQNSEPILYERSRAVARLLVDGTTLCTGWLLGSSGHLLTNQHCVGTATSALSTRVELMAEGASCPVPCEQVLGCPGLVVAASTTLVKADPGLDYALLLLPANPTAAQGYLQLRPASATVGERIYIPQHPEGWGKRLAVLSSDPTDASGFATVETLQAPGAVPEVGYRADTRPGSSGSPVLAYRDHRVIALHHAGSPACAGPNQGIPALSLVAHLGIAAPPNAVASATPIAGDAQPDGYGDFVVRSATGEVSVLRSTGRGLTGLPGTRRSFANGAAVAIGDNVAASPYPSTIDVPSFAGAVQNVRVTLAGLDHGWPEDVDALLVGPTGAAALLTSDAGSGAAARDVTLVFDDSGPELGSPITSGTYQPTNVDAVTDALPAPAPAGDHAASLSVFRGKDPVGAWSLYVRDDQLGDTGTIAGGWTLDLDTGSGSPWTFGFVPDRYDVDYADTDGDGRADLVSRSRDAGNVEVFRSTGSAFAYAPGTGPGGVWSYGWGTSYELHFADVTGDGRADLVGRWRPGGDVYVALSTARGFSSPVLWSYGWSDGYDLRFADVTGDAKADLVGRYYGPTAGLTGDVYVGPSTGAGFASPTRWTYGYSAGYEIHLADVTGDGRADLLARYLGPTAGLGGNVYVMASTGAGFVWSGSADPWAAGWGPEHDLLTRDLSGDGKADLAARSRATGDLAVLIATGHGLEAAVTWATGVVSDLDVR